MKSPSLVINMSYLSLFCIQMIVQYIWIPLCIFK